MPVVLGKGDSLPLWVLSIKSIVVTEMKLGLTHDHHTANVGLKTLESRGSGSGDCLDSR